MEENKKKKKNFLIEKLEIIDAGAEGKAVGRWDGRVVFVRNAVPGDIADVEVYRRKNNYCEAWLRTIHTRSPRRVEASCIHFGICGGCKWQNMSYESQLHFKQKQVDDQLRRIGKLDIQEFRSIAPCSEIFAYRNKMEYTFSSLRWFTEEELKSAGENKNALGFHLPGHFDRVLNIENCLLQDDTANRIRNTLRHFCNEKKYVFHNAKNHEGLMRNLILRNTKDGEWMAIAVFGENDEEVIGDVMNFLKNSFPCITSLMYMVNTKKNDTVQDLETVVWHGQPFIHETLGGLKFRIGPVSFFQTNPRQAEQLYRFVKELAAIQAQDLVYDLYTGTGTIANYVASEAAGVVGIEYIESAIHDARVNSEINNINNTTFYAGDIARTLNSDFTDRYGKPNVIITDPPRSGMHPDVVKQILEIMPERVVYVSCNPATQARDAAMMKELYHIAVSQPVDMFPQTQHVENILLMTRK